MIKRWFLYIVALISCLVFYIAYQQWVAWIVLLSVLALPLLSLLLSLPAWLTCRVREQMPRAVMAGTPMVMQITVSSPLPVPPYRVLVQTFHTLTGSGAMLGTGYPCPTGHCGSLNCKVRRIWLMDYLGLFRIPLRAPAPFRVRIRPKAIPLKDMPDLSNILVNAWRPKPGGGFAENYELRLYRPGDSLHQIHWKLTAKTGNLILREPMVPDRHRLLLWLTLQGTPEELDRKLGRLLWLSAQLLRQDLAFDILAYTGEGQQLWHVDSFRALQQAIDALLCYPPTKEQAKPTLEQEASWQYYIGGQADEEV